MVSATKVHTLSVTPETLVVEGGTDSCKLSSDFHMSTMAQHSTHTHYAHVWAWAKQIKC